MKGLKEWLNSLPKNAKTYIEMQQFTAWHFDNHFDIAYNNDYVFYQNDIAYCYRICYQNKATNTIKYLWITKNAAENYA